MKAQIRNIVNTERHKLEEVLPLEFPYSLAIDSCNLCNFKCKFCAMQYSGQKMEYRKQFMPVNLFEKIVDDLSKASTKLKVLRLSGQGEPMLHPKLAEMIQYAKEKNIAEWIEIVTNGSKLAPEINQRLVDSGVDRIRISIEALDSEGYYAMSNAKIDFGAFIDNIKDLREKSVDKCEVYIKTVDAVIETEEKKERFFSLFGNICDRIWIDQVAPLWSDFPKLNDNFVISKMGMHGQELKTVKVCLYPFYNLIINPDGDVTACYADLKRKLVFGNLNNQSFQEIWNGKNVCRKVRLATNACLLNEEMGYRLIESGLEFRNRVCSKTKRKPQKLKAKYKWMTFVKMLDWRQNS